MANHLLRPHAPHTDEHGNEATQPASRNPLINFQRGFESRFERMRASYHDLLELALTHRKAFLAGSLAVVVASFALVPFLGRNFFPFVDAGQMLIHVRAPVGTRVEETAARFTDVERAIRQIIPANEIATVADNIGAPFLSSINTVYNNTGTIGEQDGDIQISLNEGHAPTADYMRRLREELPRRFPGMTFAFLPADIVSQILNFGAPAHIDLQIRGNNLAQNFAYANKLLAQIRHVSGVADARIQQTARAPALKVNIDRARAQYAGLTTRDVTNSLVVNLAG
jgi:multidrug efflux pump subunit AcrB